MNHQKYSSFKGNIGFSQRDITPPTGIFFKCWAASTLEQAQGIHRPFKLTVMTVETGTKIPFVLVSLDASWWKDRDFEIEFRNEILSTFGLPESHLFICLSHTHAAPPLSLENKNKPGGQLLKPYFDLLLGQIKSAIKESLDRACPALIDWARGHSALAANRDFYDEKSKKYCTGYNPDKKADQTLMLARVVSKEGKTLGLLLNYACHPTTLAWENTLLSPDYVGAMRELIENKIKAPCLFLQGASGDLGPIHGFVKDPKEADKNGAILAYSALSTLENMPPSGKVPVFKGILESGASLGLWDNQESEKDDLIQIKLFNTSMPVKKDSLSKKAILDAISNLDEGFEKERMLRMLGRRKWIGDGDKVELSTWVAKLGPILIMGSPVEYYSDFQIALRKSFPEWAVFVVNHINGSSGYVVPQEYYGKTGLYQAWQSPFENGSFEIHLERCKKELKTMVHLVKESHA